MIKQKCWSLLGLFFVLFCFSSCATMTLRNQTLKYSVAVPKTWKPQANGTILSENEDVLVRVRRLRTGAGLSSVVTSLRRSFEIEVFELSTEFENWGKLKKKYPSWFFLCQYKRGKPRRLVKLYKVVVNAGDYKYVLDFEFTKGSYSKYKKVFREILESLNFFFEKSQD